MILAGAFHTYLWKVWKVPGKLSEKSCSSWHSTLYPPHSISYNTLNISDMWSTDHLIITGTWFTRMRDTISCFSDNLRSQLCLQYLSGHQYYVIILPLNIIHMIVFCKASAFQVTIAISHQQPLWVNHKQQFCYFQKKVSFSENYIEMDASMLF